VQYSPCVHVSVLSGRASERVHRTGGPGRPEHPQVYLRRQCLRQGGDEVGGARGERLRTHPTNTWVESVASARCDTRMLTGNRPPHAHGCSCLCAPNAVCPYVQGWSRLYDSSVYRLAGQARPIRLEELVGTLPGELEPQHPKSHGQTRLLTTSHPEPHTRPFTGTPFHTRTSHDEARHHRAQPRGGARDAQRLPPQEAPAQAQQGQLQGACMVHKAITCTIATAPYTCAVLEVDRLRHYCTHTWAHILLPALITHTHAHIHKHRWRW
jgi:hypothetical protein